jgi:hypothetical protein
LLVIVTTSLLLLHDSVTVKPGDHDPLFVHHWLYSQLDDQPCGGGDPPPVQARTTPAPEPACNGTELCNQVRRASSFRLPAAFFRTQRINASRLTCQLSWLEPASRSGLSLSRNDCPFPGHHFEVEAPDLLLRYPAVCSSCPFGFRVPHALRFAPARAKSLPKSRCLTPVRHSQPFLGSPLPFGAFRTLKDQSVQSDSWPGSSPSERSRLPITPRHRFSF